MRRATIADLEMSPAGVHTIALVPATLGKNGRMYRGKGLLLVITDVVASDAFGQNNGAHDKLAHAMSDAARSMFDVEHHSFGDAVHRMVDFVAANGNTLVTHNLAEDLNFLAETQDIVGGERVVKRQIRQYPDTGVYDERWSSIQKVCSMSVLANRCPVYAAAYHDYTLDRGLRLTSTGRYSNRLEDHVRFVRDDPEYVQAHSAVHDTIALADVLKRAYKLDGKLFDGATYMVTPSFAYAPKRPRARPACEIE